jgi:hypothetical protein
VFERRDVGKRLKRNVVTSAWLGAACLFEKYPVTSVVV